MSVHRPTNIRIAKLKAGSDGQPSFDHQEEDCVPDDAYIATLTIALKETLNLYRSSTELDENDKYETIGELTCYMILLFVTTSDLASLIKKHRLIRLEALCNSYAGKRFYVIFFRSYNLNTILILNNTSILLLGSILSELYANIHTMRDSMTYRESVIAIKLMKTFQRASKRIGGLVNTGHHYHYYTWFNTHPDKYIICSPWTQRDLFKFYLHKNHRGILKHRDSGKTIHLSKTPVLFTYETNKIVPIHPSCSLESLERSERYEMACWMIMFAKMFPTTVQLVMINDYRNCAFCDKQMTRGISAHTMCSGCRRARYCSLDCHKLHWPKHKPYCKITLKYIDFIQVTKQIFESRKCKSD